MSDPFVCSKCLMTYPDNCMCRRTVGTVTHSPDFKSDVPDWLKPLAIATVDQLRAQLAAAEEQRDQFRDSADDLLAQLQAKRADNERLLRNNGKLCVEVERLRAALSEGRDLVKTAHFHVYKGYQQGDPVSTVWLPDAERWLADIDAALGGES
jgi:hypothetical protein